MATCRELIIIDGKCYDIGNLGWNPKQLNPQLKKMCEGKDLSKKLYERDFEFVSKNQNGDIKFFRNSVTNEGVVVIIIK